MRLPHKKGEGKQMTKRNLLLVTLLLVFGLAATGSSLFAQGTVWSTATNVNTIRNEGDAEAAGTINLTTASTGSIMSQSGFTITYSMPIAYQKPLYAVGIAASGPDAGAILTSLEGTGGIVISGSTVQLTFTNTSPLAVSGSNAINISVRVKAQGYAKGTAVTATVTAFYQFSAATLTISSTSNTTLLVANVSGPATTVAVKEGPADVLTCIGVKDINAYDNDFSLRIKENWNDALTSLSDEFNLENNDSTYLGGDPSYTYPTNGSEILITLSGVPDLVGIVARSPRPCNNTDSSSSNYCSGGNLVIEDGIPQATNAPYGSTQSFWYWIDSTNVRAIEWADFGFKLWSKGPLPPNQSYAITASVTLTDLYPEDGSSSQVNGEMPYFTAGEVTGLAVVNFTDCVTNLLFPYINTFRAGAAYGAFSNFGTGIDFANTTWDPYALTGAGGSYIYPDMAKGSAVPQSGSCTVYFYPANEGTGSIYQTPPISAGGSYSFDVASGSGGPNGNITLVSGPYFSGETGYAIAICGFQNAYGFAEIWDNTAIAPLNPEATLGYVAYILPDPAFYHRSPAGDSLGESAIAPINFDKIWKKLFMYGSPYSDPK
jgi:hypothetical protein